jgi:hypothetical protein
MLQAFDLLTAGNVFGALVTVTATLDADTALEALAQLCELAYRDRKSVPAMTAIAWEAIRFGLKCAEAAPDSESAGRYKARVRAIAYNTGANCWPGWGDRVEIKSTDIAEGLNSPSRTMNSSKNLASAVRKSAAPSGSWVHFRWPPGSSPRRLRNSSELRTRSTLPSCLYMPQCQKDTLRLPTRHCRSLIPDKLVQ